MDALNMSNNDQIDAVLRSIVLSFRGTLHEVGITNVIELLDVREYKVGLEVLCDILGEDQIPIPEITFSQLVAIGEYLKVKSSYWESLTHKTDP